MVHVGEEIQPLMAVHAGHESITPSLRCRPDTHALHCEFDAVVHTSGVAQPSMSVQSLHTLAEPLTLRYLPVVHDVHCESFAFVQVSDDAHAFTGEHGLHTDAGPELSR